MAMVTFTANTKIVSADVNANFAGLADGSLISAGAIALSKLTATAFSTFTPASTGFSGTPTEVAYYLQIGKIAFVFYSVSGTSNATTLTFTLPVAAKRDQRFVGAAATDNGSAQTTTPYYSMTASSSTCTVYKTLADGAWTSSNSKAVSGLFFYETI